MKRITVVFILLGFLLPLFASTHEVLTTNQEISAYKHMTVLETPEEVTPPADPTSITFRIIDPSSNSEIGAGEDRNLTGEALTEATYQQNSSFSDVFSWQMTGNVFKETITVKFTFGPLSSESVPFSGSMSVSDKTKVIPYTVSLSSNETSVNGVGTIGTTQITSSNYTNYSSYSTTVSSGWSSTTYNVYCADSRTYTNNNKYIASSSEAVTFTCSMYSNSYVRKTSGITNNQNQRDNITSCNQWTRSGSASITLGLNSNGYSWSETIEGNQVTYNLERGSATYTANVVVEITVGN